MTKDDITLYMGRPETQTGRAPEELRCYDFLDGLGVPYARADHPTADTIEVCHTVEAVLGAPICKNLFLCNRQRTDFYLLLLEGDKVFRTKFLSQQLGCSRLSFADETHMLELLDIHPGSVSVLGLMNDHENRVQLLIDEDLLQYEYLGCHPCVNTSSLKIRLSDILEKFLPAVHHGYRSVVLPEEDA